MADAPNFAEPQIEDAPISTASGSSSSEEPVVPPLTFLDQHELEEAYLCMKQRDYEEAANIYSNLLEQRTQKYGETAVECGELFVRYGAALLRMAQERTEEILSQGKIEKEKLLNISEPQKLQQELQAAGQQGAEGEAPAGDAGSSNMPQEETAEELLEQSWSNFELARVIFTNQLTKSASKAEMEMWAKKLADVYLYTAEVYCENDGFAKANIEYTNALKLVSFDPQLCSEIYCNAAAVFVNQQKYAEARTQYLLAIESLNKFNQQNMATHKANLEIVADIRTRVEELQLEEQEFLMKEEVMKKEAEQYKQMLKPMFEAALNAQASGAPAPVNVLVPRRKNQPKQEQPEDPTRRQRDGSFDRDDDASKKPRTN